MVGVSLSCMADNTVDGKVVSENDAQKSHREKALK